MNTKYFILQLLLSASLFAMVADAVHQRHRAEAAEKQRDEYRSMALSYQEQIIHPPHVLVFTNYITIWPSP